MTIPLNAIDPHATSHRWQREFEDHLDMVPAVMEVLVWMTIPSIRASRFDQIRISGGGFIDNITDPDTTAEGVAVADARHLWTWLVAYTRSAAEWINPTRPAPDLEDAPNPDPLTARGITLTTVGWLIDQAALIEQVPELEDHREAMFAEIRHLRGKYGVTPHPRRNRPRALCTTCGEKQVVITWVDGANGSPKSVQAGRCKTCGATYTEQDEQIRSTEA